MGSTENLVYLTRSLIKSRFSEYYKKNGSTIVPPPSTEHREFGFLLFAEGMMIRHRSFRQASNLRKFIETTVPSDIYYSAAYYTDPEAPMEKKGWIGSDLIFDIDADHIDTECKRDHDRWLCVQCKTSGHGQMPQSCPNCTGQRLKMETWMCCECLEKAKEEVTRLIRLLNLDFGVDLDEMQVNFSGHRGYHLHVTSEEVRSLGSKERKEIVDYIIGTGLDMDLLGIYDHNGKPTISAAPNLGGLGWKGRIARRMKKILSEADRGELRKIGLKSNIIETIMRTRNEELRSQTWNTIEGAGKQTWQSIFHRIVLLEAVCIDTVVTTDIHRLIRLPETLNGKTGLRAMRVDIEELPRFNPLKQAVAFDGVETIHIEEAPRFIIGNNEYGPFSDAYETLPTAAAILLLCKGRAQPVVKKIA